MVTKVVILVTLVAVLITHAMLGWDSYICMSLLLKFWLNI